MSGPGSAAPKTPPEDGEMNRWSLLKDILLTGTGMAVILSQVFAPHPSNQLLLAGLALTGVSAAGHAKTVLTGRGGKSSSRSSQSSQSSPSPPSSSGGHGE